MNTDPYSIPPPQGWAPPTEPERQVIPPPIGADPVSEMIPPPINTNPIKSYPISPPIGGAVLTYPMIPPRGWTPATEPHKQEIQPPIGYSPPIEFEMDE
jgi:hypothetical protein